MGRFGNGIVFAFCLIGFFAGGAHVLRGVADWLDWFTLVGCPVAAWLAWRER